MEPLSEMNGPSLEQYVETRFNLLEKSVQEKLNAQDLRYQQRFEAQSDALTAAFLSQQTAMQTAFTVAEKAVQAALAAADRAVSKAELASDKRFEALNELRQMLNDMVASLLTRNEANSKFDGLGEKISAGEGRMTNLQSRIDVLAAGTTGGRTVRDDFKSNMAAIISLVVLVVLLWRAFTGH